MKILEVGTKKYQPSYIYTCEQCGCKFQFFEWELNYKNGNYRQCKCPQCNSLITIKNLDYYKE